MGRGPGRENYLGVSGQAGRGGAVLIGHACVRRVRLSLRGSAARPRVKSAQNESNVCPSPTLVKTFNTARPARAAATVARPAAGSL